MSVCRLLTHRGEAVLRHEGRGDRGGIVAGAERHRHHPAPPRTRGSRLTLGADRADTMRLEFLGPSLESLMVKKPIFSWRAVRKTPNASYSRSASPPVRGREVAAAQGPRGSPPADVNRRADGCRRGRRRRLLGDGEAAARSSSTGGQRPLQPQQQLPLALGAT
jgi:hypothetical protein